MIPKVTRSDTWIKLQQERAPRAKHIAGIITGCIPLGDGDAVQWGVAPAGTFLVINFLQIVQATVHGFDLGWTTLKFIFSSKWCHNESDYTPDGATEYKFVEFNAWTYQGSDLLWASLMNDLWGAVEAQFGKQAVRYHRAGIALANEDPFDESFRALSPEEKAKKRKRALLMFRARYCLSFSIFLVATAVTLALILSRCTDPDTCGRQIVNATNGTITAFESMGVGYKSGVTGTIVLAVAAFFKTVANGKGNHIDGQ